MNLRLNPRVIEYVIIIPVISLAVNSLILNGNFRDFLFTLVVATMTNLFCWTCSHLLDYLGIFYLKIRYGLNIPYRKNRLLSYLKGTAFLIPGLIISLYVARLLFGVSAQGRAFGSSLDWKIGAVFVSILLIFEAFVAFMEHARLTKSDYEKKLYLADLESKKAELTLLSAQMNPHFLFNSLNTIAESMHGDLEHAEEMIINLSDFYRSTLLSLKFDNHLLEDELKICDQYLKMEKYRFGDRLDYSIRVSDTEGDLSAIYLPPLLIQPFVENAVKYGVECRRGHCEITINCKEENDFFILEVLEEGHNIAVGRTSAGAGVAVDNCKKRMKILYGEDSKISIESGDLYYFVKIKINLSKARGVL